MAHPSSLVPTWPSWLTSTLHTTYSVADRQDCRKRILLQMMQVEEMQVEEMQVEEMMQVEETPMKGAEGWQTRCPIRWLEGAGKGHGKRGEGGAGKGWGAGSSVSDTGLPNSQHSSAFPVAESWIPGPWQG